MIHVARQEVLFVGKVAISTFSVLTHCAAYDCTDFSNQKA